MKRTIRLLALGSLLALAFPFVGCEKEMDEGDGMIEIFAETMGSNSKVRLDGANSTWENGDPICINGNEVSVVRGDNGRAYINYANPLSVNRAVYPASLAANSDLSSDSISLDFPAYYHYRTDASGHQLLEVPMAARSTNREPLQFKHLTGALYVTVKNTANVPLILQSVTVASNIYQLNGSRNVDLDDLNNIAPIRTTTNDSRNTVTLVFDTGYTLASNASVRVMLPVMPVGGNGNNLFTIKVRSCSANKQSAYLASNTQSAGSDHTLARNELGYAPVNISVSEETQPLDQQNGHYVVRTPLDFKLMTESITRGKITEDAQIDILEDLDMTDIPITTINTSQFSGTLNGNNHTINNLTINSRDLGTSNCYCALFKQLPTSASIKNITLNNLTLRHNINITTILKIASLVGSLEQEEPGSDSLVIENCNVNICSIDINGAIGSIYYGGIICEPTGQGGFVAIKNCHVSMTNISVRCADKSLWWGGLIGYSGAGKTHISSSTLDGTATLRAKNLYVGGMIGRKNSNRFTAKNNTISATITATSDEGTAKYLGKMIGYYSTPGVIDTAGNQLNVNLTFNGTVINDVFGINRQ